MTNQEKPEEPLAELLKRALEEDMALSRERRAEAVTPEQVEEEMNQIQELLQNLKPFETDRPHGENDEVDKALKIIREIFEPGREGLVEDEFIPIYHGSLQYHDPHNLDVDIAFASEEIDEPDYQGMISTYEPRFQERIDDWPRERCDTNFGKASLEDIRRQAKYYNETGIYDVNRNDQVDQASEILSSVLLFPEQAPLLQKLKAEVLDVARGCTILRRGIIADLEETLDIRRERRKELGF